MGSVIGCTNNLCLQKTTKEMSIDILKNNNFDNIYTVNSTAKNEQTKPSVLVQEKEKEEIKPINNEKEYKEKEEEDDDEEIKEEKVQEEIDDSFKIVNKENNENQEEKIVNINKINSQKTNSNKDRISNNNNKYELHINKIILIQRKYRKHREKIKEKEKEKEKEIKETKKKGNNFKFLSTIIKYR